MKANYFEFHNPLKILSGDQALENLPYELERLGVKAPLLVTERQLLEIGLVAQVAAVFAGAGIKLGGMFSEVPVDSSTQVVNQIAALFRELQCDALIAVGGGSVIDTAKGVNIVVSQGQDDLVALMGAETLHRPMKPLIVIPTTAGTGSEATRVAVIADLKRQVKLAFTSHRLIPDVAILDPRMTCTLPPLLTAATGMDALTHAVEAYTGLQKNPLSDACAVAAIELIRENLLSVVIRGEDRQARLALANAALLAGVAFSNSMVGIVHAVGHALGAVCHLPHGVAMAVLLPFGMEYNLKSSFADYAALLLPLADAEVYAATPHAARPAAAIAVVRTLLQELQQQCELPCSLREAGVNQTQFAEIADKALDDGALLFNPVEADREDLFNLLRNAW
ncbi:MAG: iron-containing alcohol dehydrogenase [Geopsychrobacter sp.]|nr:iron-containing alcohol dehydrogenase [Geopsychrobacter sp.]